MLCLRFISTGALLFLQALFQVLTVRAKCQLTIPFAVTDFIQCTCPLCLQCIILLFSSQISSDFDVQSGHISLVCGVDAGTLKADWAKFCCAMVSNWLITDSSSCAVVHNSSGVVFFRISYLGMQNIIVEICSAVVWGM